MKIVGLTVLHYGSDFLESAIKSIAPVVDEHHILYSRQPSFSFNSDIPNPDTEEQLRAIAGDMVIWHSYERFDHEGHHRNEIKRFTDIKDIIVVVDADEIWKTSDLYASVELAARTKARNFNINGFVNFWKSFEYIVIDWFQPTRIYRYDQPIKTEVINATIYHLGYMISPEAMRYKLSIHGHRNDIEQVHGSADNYFNKWNDWTKPGCGIVDLHPASETIWHDAEIYKGKLPTL